MHQRLKQNSESLTALSGIFLLFFGILAGCRPLPTSPLSDIYREDASSQSSGNGRRHAASKDEILWTVQTPGCTAIMLNAQTLLTAEHCGTPLGERLRSGWSILTGGSEDLEVTSVLEKSEALDYRILQVRWLTAVPSQIKYPPRVATSSSELFSSMDSDQGDDLFTVGFPDDRAGVWTATYAEGQAKAAKSQQLFFNIGIINGSSGGGVLKKENSMLVSLANGGSRSLGDPGWNSADKNSPASWNYGTGLWQIYSQSALLPKLFPQGVNSEYKGTFQAKTKIYLSISGKGEAADMWLAASAETEQMVLCPGIKPYCQATTIGAESMNIHELRQGRSFFRSKSSPESLTDFALSAFNKSGELIGQRQVQLEKGP